MTYIPNIPFVIAMENIDQKTLFVALTPGQAADLVEGRSVFPQETSERFGFRTTKEEAIARAHYFHQWHSRNVDTSQEEIPQKGFIIATMRLSAEGYLSKMEGGVLLKTKETEYRWFGGIQNHERLPDGRPLYEIVNMEEIV